MGKFLGQEYQWDRRKIGGDFGGELVKGKYLGKPSEGKFGGNLATGEIFGNLARGKHCNSLVSSLSSVTRPAIPPSIALLVKCAKWGFLCSPRQTGAHQAFRLIAFLQRNITRDTFSLIIHSWTKCLQCQPTSRSPFLPQSGLNQDPGPASLDLKEESVRVGDQVVRAGLDEESLSQLRFEDDLVQENVLPSLAEAGTKSVSSYLTNLLLGQPFTFPSFHRPVAGMLQNGTCRAQPKRATKEVLSSGTPTTPGQFARDSSEKACR